MQMYAIYKHLGCCALISKLVLMAIHSIGADENQNERENATGSSRTRR
jgi:hypothetical protein